jgi:RNA polymerase sigma-70 factor (sigma-E family)
MNTPDDDFSGFAKGARPVLRRIAFSLSADWYEADDLVQRTLIAMHTHWQAINDQERVVRYAHKIMLRLLLCDRRSQRWSREVLHELPPEPDPPPDPYAALGDRELLMGALASLGPRQQTAVFLRYWEDRSVEETAEAMGCTPSTVRSQSVRALATLRSVLAAEGDTRADARVDARAGVRAGAEYGGRATRKMCPARPHGDD